MKRRKVLAMLMTAVMTFTSLAPESALMVQAEDGIVIEEVSEEETDASASENASEEAEVSENAAAEEAAVSEDEAVSADEAEESESEEEAEVKDLPAGIKGMPEGYVLSAEEKEIKANVASHDVVGAMSGTTEGVDYASDEVFFLANEEGYAKQVADAYGAELKSFDGYVAVLDLSNSGLSVEEAVAIGADPAYEIPAVEANYIITVENGYENMTDAEIESYQRWIYKNVENGWLDEVGKMSKPDPYLLPNDMNYQWWHDVIGSYAAWGVYGYDFSGSGIKVAVIDTGVNPSHEDFTGHISADGNDANGHGSNVAGIIGATANNGKGGAGIAPGVQILGYACENANGSLNISKVISSVKAATDSKADIINMSLGGPMYNASFEEAINYAYAKDVTIVVAAGNEASNSVHYPAFYDHVITVAAAQPDGSLTTFSNYGDFAVDIAAPGADMMSCNKGAANSYVKMQGTSQASPVVAGACALYMSIVGKVTPDEMLKVLKDSAVPTKAKGDGVGIVNVANMFRCDTNGPELKVMGADGNVVTVEGGKSATVTVLADAVVSVKATNFNGVDKSNSDTQIFYTGNGKTPSFYKYGEATYETLCCTDGNIPLHEYPFYSNAYNGGKYTLKAQAVTAMGISSKITTLTLIVKPGEDSGLSISGPNHLAKGKSGTYTAYLTRQSGTVTGTSAAPKGVTWSITAGDNLATINKTSGVLKVNKDASGTVTIEAKYGEKSATTTVTVGNAPVKSITISENKVNLSYDRDSEVFGTTYNKEISLTKVVDTEGNDITASTDISYSWSSSNLSVVRASAIGNGSKGRLTARGKGTAKVTVTANDGSGVKAVIQVKVVNLVRTINVYGQNNIAQGDKGTYTVYVYPKDAQKKEVAWSISPEIAGVTVDAKKGVVNVASSVPAGTTFKVVATTTDGGNRSASKTVEVVTAKSKGITITTAADDPAYALKKKGDSLTSIQLFTANVPSSSVDESQIRVVADLGVVGSDPVWTSNKNSVAQVSYSGNEATIRAISKGSAKITCAASDGSGKKVSIKVNVIVPVSGLQFSNDILGTYADPNGDEASSTSVGIGIKAKTKVSVIQSYGKATKTKVNWSIEPVYVTANSDGTAYVSAKMSEAKAKAAMDAKLITGSNGQICFNKNYVKMYGQYMEGDYYFIGAKLKATTTDGTNITVERLFIPEPAVTAVKAYNGLSGKYENTVYYKDPAQDHFQGLADDEGYLLGVQVAWTGATGADFKVESSDPSIATGYFQSYGSKYPGQGIVYISHGSKKGKATLTVTAKDGSKKKCKIVFTVY